MIHSLRNLNLELKRRSGRKVILMNSVNKVTLIGHLGKDPEVRYTQAGQPVASFSLATSEKWTDNGGQKQEKTEWHNIVAWGKTAEICGQYLRKGSPAYIEGKITTRTWDDRDGAKKYKTEIVAHQVIFLAQNQGQAPQQSGGDYPQYSQQQGDHYPQPQENFGATPTTPEEDLPF